jgi:uncharacterized protein (DUF952 family)
MTLVYKIIAAKAWAEALSNGVFIGASIDLADGYIHLSDSSQVEQTARLHFSGQGDLLLVTFDAAGFGDQLKWEASRGGALFPHVYGSIVPSQALWAKPLPWNGTSHDFPEGWKG